LLSWFGGGEIFLESGKDIFLWCSALQVFGQVAEQCGLGFAEAIFWGYGFRKTSATFGFRKRRRRGLGRNPPLAPFVFLAKFGADTFNNYSNLLK